MHRFFTVLLAIVLVASTAFADTRVVGHPTPLPEELLENPVTLNCGATVREVDGPTPNYANLNSMCTHAHSNFFKFIEAKGLRTQHRRAFTWNLSFIPESASYRDLNDERYRFHNRFIRGRVIGYTSRNHRYAFMSSRIDSEYNVTFVHELFHSMSMHYGVYDNHPGTWAEKTATDERLAVEFTEWLGYGR